MRHEFPDIGCSVDSDERSILSLPPHFAAPKDLESDSFAYDLEISNAKVRWDKVGEPSAPPEPGEEPVTLTEAE